jgi:hypothetical protein
MEGLLREKCVERGLSLPYLGGDVKMRAFLVRHIPILPSKIQNVVTKNVLSV